MLKFLFLALGGFAFYELVARKPQGTPQRESGSVTWDTDPVTFSPPAADPAANPWTGAQMNAPNPDAAAIGLSDEEYGNMLAATAADLGQTGSGQPAPMASTNSPITDFTTSGRVGTLTHYGEVHPRTRAPIVRDRQNRPFAVHGRTLYPV